MAAAYLSALQTPCTTLSYCCARGQLSKDAILPAQIAFKEGSRIFDETLTKDERKRQLLADLRACSLRDVLNTVTDARNQYESRKGSSTMQSAITSLSRRLHYYSNVVDVFASSHPEYASLAWGMMKLLFGAVVEHDRIKSTLFVALSELADSLPRVELSLTLFPSVQMQEAVAKLYACIVKLLLRALKWYEEGALAHAIHAITRPVAIRYSDLINECRSNTETIKSIANVSSHAELRDVHQNLVKLQKTTEGALQVWHNDRNAIKDQVTALSALFEGVRSDLARDRATSMAAHISIGDRLSDIQFVQSLDHVSSRCSIDHKAILHLLVSRYGRQRRPLSSERAPFWMSAKMIEWNASSSSCSIFLKGTYQERLAMTSFCANVIQQLLSSTTAVLYILQEKDRLYSLHEILKSLINQCLSQTGQASKASADSSFIRQFCTAQLDEDYIALLGRTLEQFDLVFIIVNAESMEPDTAIQCRSVLRDICRKLADRRAKTVLRIMNTSQSPRYPADIMVDDKILNIGGVRGQRQTPRMAINRNRPKRLANSSDPLANMWQGRKRTRIR